MQTSYTIKGMTCQNCVAKVKALLEATPGVQQASVGLDNPQAIVQSSNKIQLQTLQQQLGKFEITPVLEPSTTVSSAAPLAQKSLQTYKPLILIVAFIAGVSLLVQYPFDSFSTHTWMRHFMAGFFIVFAFFKLLNLSGFARSYAMYDLLAARWKSWGYIYPFIELALGIAYLINFNPTFTNLATIAVLGFSSLGVIKSNLDKRQIKCACLGDVFNLPMSVVTIVEDVSMVLMAVFMLL